MKIHPRILFLAAFALAIPAGAAPAFHWICSTQAEPWKDLPIPAPSAASAPPAGSSPLKLDPQTTYQVIDGFGGCFNDLGWQALLALDSPAREAALKELFDPAAAHFTLCRMPIGANDFSLKWYSFDETPGDYAMKDFSIERDRSDLIPYIKAAMKYQPALAIWGVPWSPPSWMKTNGHYKGGNMKQDPQTLAAYARYFSKYVTAYRAQGINIYAVMPQNEPIYNNGIYPQCDWSGALLNLFLRDYLVPRLHQDHVKVQVWLGTVDSGKIGDYIDPVLGDPVTNPAITGVGSQYEGQLTMLDTHLKYPGKKLAQTETECYNGDNSWDQAMTTFRKIIDDTNHFAGSYFFWNMILNESGRSTWNWRQNSLLTVDRKSGTVTRNPEYYAMSHFSANVPPGAKRIAVTGGPFKNVVAFLTPAGSKVLLFLNDTPQPISATLQSGLSTIALPVPARSMNTLIISAD
jgi:glucosylceramidase